MQAPPPRFAYQPSAGLQRSNSAPDLRILLSAPLNPIPQVALQGGMNPFVGSSSTAGALVPYKAPEVRCKGCNCAYPGLSHLRNVCMLQLSPETLSYMVRLGVDASHSVAGEHAILSILGVAGPGMHKAAACAAFCCSTCRNIVLPPDA